jgi:hypothetical protein
VILGFALLFLTTPASALIQVGRGNQPVSDPGWPSGSLALANLESRVGWWEGPPFGGGEWQFLYRGNTEAFERALAVFASIRAPALDLVIHDGPENNTFLKDESKTNSDTRVDWTFTVWVPANWHHLYNNPKSVFAAESPNFRQPVDPPRLDVYIGDGGGVDWTKIKVPAGLHVRDERASASGVNPSGGAIVRADIFDMATGKPVPAAHLIIARLPEGRPNAQVEYETVAEATGDALGRVELAKLRSGILRVSVAADGYAHRIMDYSQYRENSFRHFNTELSHLASVRGAVVDSDGKPLKGVTVRADSVMGINGRGYNSPDAKPATTDKSGQFEITGLPTGYTQLYASASGYHFSDLFTIHDVPATNLVLRLDGAGSVKVQVTDKSGAPLARFGGAELIVEIEPTGGSKIGSWGGSSTVHEDGTVEFKDVPPGDYKITSRPNPSTTNRQYAPDQNVKVTPGAPVNVRIVYE